MRPKKINVLRLGMVFLVGGMLLVTGCSRVEPTRERAPDNITTVNPATAAAAETALTFYHAVALDQTRAEVELYFGGPGERQDDAQVSYVDPASGYGVWVLYDDENKVFAKTLIATALAPELVALNPTPVSDRQAYRIAVGMPYYEIQEIMGSDGIEISLSKADACCFSQITSLGWFNPDGSRAIVTLNLPEGKASGSEFIATSVN